VWIVPCLEGGSPTRTSGSSIYPAVQNMLPGGASARSGRDIDDALSAIREGSRGDSGPSAKCPLVCPAADWLPDGKVWASSSYRPCRCRLRRSVGAALPRSVAAQGPAVMVGL